MFAWFVIDGGTVVLFLFRVCLHFEGILIWTLVILLLTRLVEKHIPNTYKQLWTHSNYSHSPNELRHCIQDLENRQWAKTFQILRFFRFLLSMPRMFCIPVYKIHLDRIFVRYIITLFTLITESDSTTSTSEELPNKPVA